MHLQTYQELIRNLSVVEQTFTAEKSTWVNISKKVNHYGPQVMDLFNNQSNLQLSRADLFATEDVT